MTGVSFSGQRGAFWGALRAIRCSGPAVSELTPEDLRAIDGAASKIRGEDARYPALLENRTGL